MLSGSSAQETQRSNYTELSTSHADVRLYLIANYYAHVICTTTLLKVTKRKLHKL